MIKNKDKTTLDNKTKKQGRPTVFTQTILDKLERGFSMSLTDEECCLYVDIHPSTLYYYIEKNPEFGKRKEILKKKPNIGAKETWTNKIKSSDYQASKDWLERKSRDEFSLKTIGENTNLNLDKDITDMSDDELLKLSKGIT